MFWGSFTYDRKGPCHCWQPESKKEKELAARQIAELNEQLEPVKRAEWELNTAMSRAGLRNRGGPKPLWSWTVDNGKLVRGSKGGIDWWRYQHVILMPKLLPFAKACLKERPGTIVMEDNAPAHAHHAQRPVYDLHGVQKMIWCPNSPDLNMIEPCWWHMKVETTRDGAPTSRTVAVKAWEKCWKELPQERIQRWIERITWHIQRVIELEGGNEYLEALPRRRKAQ